MNGLKKCFYRLSQIYTQTIEYPLLKFCSRHSLFASFYYFFISRALWREHRALVSARAHYLKIYANPSRLRRNIHRLEKGLIMKPRAETFASDYISETVDIFSKLKDNISPVILDDLNWANDVLTEFFRVVKPDIRISEAHQRFLNAQYLSSKGPARIPFPRGRMISPIKFEDLYALAIQRRSIRFFEQRPVSRDLIDQAIDIARLSPSACNRQAFEFRIFDDPDLVRKIGSIPMGAAGLYQNFPAIAVVVGHLSAYATERDRHVIYIDGSLAAMSFMLALETLGLSSCPINWPEIESRDALMMSRLGLAYDERVVMLIALGYADPDGLIPFSEKKNIEQIRSYNKIS